MSAFIAKNATALYPLLSELITIGPRARGVLHALLVNDRPVHPDGAFCPRVATKGVRYEVLVPLRPAGPPRHSRFARF